MNINGQNYNVSEIIIHEGYVKKGAAAFTNDVCLIRTEQIMLKIDYNIQIK